MSIDRIAQLRISMQKAGLDAVALNPSPNTVYLTGLHYHLMERPIIILIPLKGEIISILPEFEVGKLGNSPVKIKPFSYGDNPAAWPEVFKKAAAFLGLDKMKIGVDPNHFRFLETQYLQEAAPNAKFIGAGETINALRECKDAQEINAMREAVKIAQNAFQDVLKIIKPGVSEQQIAQELTFLLLRHGSDSDFEFPPIVASGPNSANPHHTPSDRKLVLGDALVIDWGAKVNGYFSDLTRNVFLGQPPEEYKKIHEATLKANAAGRAAGRPGIQAGKVDQATRAVIDANGFGAYFSHRTGHGLGMETHEPVYIFEENTQILKEGNVYTIEPGIYLPGKFGVRIEDDVVVTADGSQSLSDYPRDLVIL